MAEGDEVEEGGSGVGVAVGVTARGDGGLCGGVTPVANVRAAVGCGVMIAVGVAVGSRVAVGVAVACARRARRRCRCHHR